MIVSQILSERILTQGSHTDPEADAVAHSVKRLFQASVYRQLRQLSCDHHEGVLIIRGRLP